MKLKGISDNGKKAPISRIRIQEYKAKCPQCGCEFETTCPVCGQIAKASRMTVTQLHNGGLTTVIRKLEFATLAIDRAGIEFDQQKLVSQTLEAATKAFTDKRIEELKDLYQGKIKEIEQAKEKDIIQLEKDKNKEITDTIKIINREKELEKKTDIDKLNVQLGSILKELTDEKNRNKDLNDEIVRLRTELTINPARKGEKSEKDLAATLKLAFPNDEIIHAEKGKNEIDIVQKVNHDKKLIGKIVVECKNVKSWSNKWINKTLEHMNRESTEFGIISTTAMPNETNLNPLGLFKEGILITSPENTKWSVAAFRLALIRSESAMRTLQNERQRLSKEKQIKEKLIRLINSEDFQTVFDACKDIKEKSQGIRNRVNKTKSEILAISDDTESIDDIVDTVIRTNTKLSEAFDSLSE